VWSAEDDENGRWREDEQRHAHHDSVMERSARRCAALQANDGLIFMWRLRDIRLFLHVAVQAQGRLHLGSIKKSLGSR